MIRHSETLEQVAALGSIATVWAHPDDEAYLAAGLMATARQNGQAVTCVTATNGDFATSEHARARIGRARAVELANALAVLGVGDVEYLGLRDGECDDVDDEIGIAMIGAVLAHRAPNTIITFGPDGLTGHPDHRAVARWTAAAAQVACPQANILVPVVTPEIERDDRDINSRFDVFGPGTPSMHARSDLALELDLADSWLSLKYLALRAHHSQTAGLIDALGEDRYLRWISRETFLPLSRWHASRQSVAPVAEFSGPR